MDQLYVWLIIQFCFIHVQAIYPNIPECFFTNHLNYFDTEMNKSNQKEALKNLFFSPLPFIAILYPIPGILKKKIKKK